MKLGNWCTEAHYIILFTLNMRKLFHNKALKNYLLNTYSVRDPKLNDTAQADKAADTKSQLKMEFLLTNIKFLERGKCGKKC